MNLIGLGSRNISSFCIDKDNYELTVQKTWSFFSDKIKILFESGDNVFFLNSEKFLCLTNSKNQSIVRVISDLLLEQAVMFSDVRSNCLYLIAECESALVILKILNNEIIEQKTFACDAIESPICLRGNFCFIKTHHQILVLHFNNMSESFCETFKIKSEFNSIDILGRDDENGSFCILGYNFSESEGKICTINTSECTIQRTISFKDSSLVQSKIEFGRYLCFSGKVKNMNYYLII